MRGQPLLKHAAGFYSGEGRFQSVEFWCNFENLHSSQKWHTKMYDISPLCYRFSLHFAVISKQLLNFSLKIRMNLQNAKA